MGSSGIKILCLEGCSDGIMNSHFFFPHRWNFEHCYWKVHENSLSQHL